MTIRWLLILAFFISAISAASANMILQGGIIAGPNNLLINTGSAFLINTGSKLLIQ